MPRAAGSSTHYADEIWRPNYTGTADPGPIRPLPSVTHVIKSTLANPTLVGWAYRQTRDVIAGMIQVLYDLDLPMSPDEDGFDELELLGDADILEEWLKDNKLRLSDITKMHANRGTAEHFHLEELARAQVNGFNDRRIAERNLKSDNGWRRTISEWWLFHCPKVIASERVLPNPTMGYCGSVDLIWETQNGMLGVTDLKTRLDDREAYDSDEFQVDAYATAWMANGGREPDFLSVLVAMPDTPTIDHREFAIERGAFGKVLDLYQARKGESLTS